MSRVALMLAFALVAAVCLLTAREAASEQQWLTNGGFEAGSGSWLTVGGTSTACQPHEGSGALGVSVTGSATGSLRQQVAGPLPAATYTLSGWTRLQSGSGTVRVILGLVAPGGTVRGIAVPQDIPSGPDYTPFSVSTSLSFSPESAIVELSVQTTGGAVLCVDSLELTTPDPPPTATPSPTATSAATATLTPSPTPSITPVRPSPSPTPSATASKTATPTRTPKPGPTATPEPSFVFTNGGFEQGLLGWSKYGGTLATAGGAHSGVAAGLLTSTTGSTKWAFQSVAIDPSRFYEFAGYVWPDAGVGEAYLRISWYASAFAEGAALSTADSTERLAGDSAGYGFLTTGSVQPPPNAASARVRVMLAPSGPGPASLRLDDISFGVAPPPTATPTATVPASPTPTPSTLPTATATPAIPLLGAIVGPSPEGVRIVTASGETSTSSSTTSVTTTSSRQATTASTPADTSEVAARSEPATRVPDPEAFGADRGARTDDASGGLPWPWIAGAVLVVVGLGGTYLQNRNAAR